MESPSEILENFEKTVESLNLKMKPDTGDIEIIRPRVSPLKTAIFTPTSSKYSVLSTRLERHKVNLSLLVFTALLKRNQTGDSTLSLYQKLEVLFLGSETTLESGEAALVPIQINLVNTNAANFRRQDWLSVPIPNEIFWNGPDSERNFIQYPELSEDYRDSFLFQGIPNS